MPKLSIETSEKEKPIALVAGNSNPLIKFLLDRLSQEFKIAFVSSSNIETGQNSTDNSNDFYRINPDSAYLVKNLEEKIDYAVIFLEEEQNRRYLPHLFEKLIEDHTKTIIIVDVSRVEEFYDVILEYKKSANFYFLLLGDIYGEHEPSTFNSEISKSIDQAIKEHRLILTGNDLSPIFPIYYQDALTGISQIMLGPAKGQKFYYLFYSHPQTYISLIHVLSRVEPDLEIQYAQKEGEENVRQSREQIEELFKAKILVTPSYLDKYFLGFEKSIQNFQNYKPDPFKESVPVEVKQQKKITKKIIKD